MARSYPLLQTVWALVDGDIQLFAPYSAFSANIFYALYIHLYPCDCMQAWNEPPTHNPCTHSVTLGVLRCKVGCWSVSLGGRDTVLFAPRGLSGKLGKLSVVRRPLPGLWIMNIDWGNGSSWRWSAYTQKANNSKAAYDIDMIISRRRKLMFGLGQSPLVYTTYAVWILRCECCRRSGGDPPEDASKN